MKKILFSLFATLFAATALFAQTPEEIVARMERETDRFETEGFSMIFEIKIPIIGTMGTTVSMLGDKYKMIAEAKGTTIINWSDRQTNWQYDPAKNEIVITKAKSSGETDAESNMKVLKGVTDGYDVRIQKETVDAWYLLCTKSKSNKDKDDPKKMDLVISKSTYLPISVKSTLKGITVTMRNFAAGVSEEEVTFDPAKYPKARIIDQR